jgi:nucleotide-binding universal stress UspA family protein
MRVLVPLDGSDLAETAVEAIAGFVRDTESEVHLCSVFHPDQVHGTAYPGVTHALTPQGAPGGQPLNVSEPRARVAEDRAQALARVRSEHEIYLRTVGEKKLSGMTVKIHAESSEKTAETIADIADKLGADFIAMASHGRSGLGHALFGSTAEQVLRQARVPVLIVGPAAQERIGTQGA